MNVLTPAEQVKFLQQEVARLTALNKQLRDAISTARAIRLPREEEV